MKKNTNCMQTIYACFIGYIVQAIVNNFVPLLFVTFQNNYHISLEILYLICDYPHKHYTFKHFEV